VSQARGDSHDTIDGPFAKETIRGTTDMETGKVAVDYKSLNPASAKMLEQNLSSLVINQIGAEHWEMLLRRLGELEQSTGGMLRRSPRGTERQGRGDDETSPLLLFAPDRDRDGREFSSVAGRDILYVDRNVDSAGLYKYTILSEHDVQWWRQLSNRQKGVVISVLERILCSLRPDAKMADL